MTPGGVRIGTPAVTSRGMKEQDMIVIADFLDRLSRICIETQNKGGKNLKQFTGLIENNEEIKKLKSEVEVRI